MTIVSFTKDDSKDITRSQVLGDVLICIYCAEKEKHRRARLRLPGIKHFTEKQFPSFLMFVSLGKYSSRQRKKSKENEENILQTFYFP